MQQQTNVHANNMIVKVQYMSNFRKGHCKVDNKIENTHSITRYLGFA
jgi:hypothetical protein